MLIFTQENTDFQYMVQLLAKIGGVIGTPYLSFSDESVTDFIASFVKIQLSRRFNPYISGIDLELNINQNRVAVNYTSTSETYVFFCIDFDDDMQVSTCTVSVHLPDERCQPGRCHYEGLTQLFYEYDWLEVVRNTDSGCIDTIKIANKHQRTIDKQDGVLPTPQWLLNKRSNYYADDTNLYEKFSKFGYVGENIPFTVQGWVNYGTEERILERKVNWSEDKFALVSTRNEKYPEHWLSYRELLLLLKQEQDKLKNKKEFSESCNEHDLDDSVDYEKTEE